MQTHEKPDTWIPAPPPQPPEPEHTPEYYSETWRNRPLPSPEPEELPS